MGALCMGAPVGTPGLRSGRRPGIAAAAQQAGGPAPSADQQAAFEQVVGAQIFTEGATNAFLVGSLMMLLASVVVFTLLNVKHEELATDGPEGAHVGV